MSANEQKSKFAPIKSYGIRARNTAADSENKIHDDEIASRYGFRGGLVPGVTVYAYMTVPLVESFGEGWLERGAMQVKFNRPVYEGESLTIRADVDNDTEPRRVFINAEREDGEVCAVAIATLDDKDSWMMPQIDDYPIKDLPESEARSKALRENFIIGAAIGTLTEKIDLTGQAKDYLQKIDEHLPNYFGERAVLHPGYLLSLANQIFVCNFTVSPWIHVGSELINRSAVRDGERLAVRGRIAECFERKGHEFVVLDLLFVANENRIAAQARHTAIYKLQEK
ncbi:MAG: MaoC family dehydratase [Acidobacteriota bacterium]